MIEPPATPPPAIELAELSHTYPARKSPGHLALDRVSLAIAPGTIFGLLGPNGSGKTTLFRILCTLLTPRPSRRGAATIFGDDVLDDPAKVRANLGVVFQSPSLDAKLTAEENLRYQGGLYGMSSRVARERAGRLLELFSLGDRARDLIENLSGGMRRRVELAKSIMHRPRLLLMDEPATGLDPSARRELWDNLRRLRQDQGVTIVLTTHLMEEAERCDRLGILSHGRLVAHDTPDALRSRIGGEVVSVRVDAEPMRLTEVAQEVASVAREALGPWDGRDEPKVVDDQVVFESADGAAAVAELGRRCGGKLRSLTVGRPTLDDVFFKLTGALFDAEALESKV